MKIFMGALGTETNTFSPLPTGWDGFKETLFCRGDATKVSDNFFAVPLHVWKKLSNGEGHTVMEGLAAFAQPAGLTIQNVWEALRDEMLADIAAAGPVDIVFLHMHGAMVSERCDDCEGELLTRLRSLVGPHVIVAVELDLHCHLTDRMVEAASLIVLYKEYPHFDIGDRAADLYRLARDAAERRIRPVMALRDCRMLGIWRTPMQPARALVDEMLAAEGGDGVLSLSFCHGFPWSDVPDVGAKFLAIADGDPARAAALAETWALKIWDGREASRQSFITLDEAVKLALDTQGETLVIADVSDNAGGGAASDATFLLRALHAGGASRVALGCIWDPVSVRICREAGEGARLSLRIGGKVGPLSGEPLDLDIVVKSLVADASQPFGGGRQAMGRAALVEAGGIDVVLQEVRTQTFHPEAFTQFGVRLTDYRSIFVKSAQHFYSAFAPHADRVLYAAGPGTYRRIS